MSPTQSDTTPLPPPSPSPSHSETDPDPSRPPNITETSPSTNDLYENLPESVSELQLKIYPTIPMQTQALADFCIACLEEALTVYSIERLMSACGNGLMTYNPSSDSTKAHAEGEGGPRSGPGSHQLLEGIEEESDEEYILQQKSNEYPHRPVRIQSPDLLQSEKQSTPIRRVQSGGFLNAIEKKYIDDKKGPEVSVETVVNLTSNNKNTFESKINEYTKNENENDNVYEVKSLCNPTNSLFPSPIFSDFLRFYHGALGATPSSPLFLSSSNGVMRMPFCLPKAKVIYMYILPILNVHTFLFA